MRPHFLTRPSALTAIGGFSVAIAILSVAITASIVLLMPDPPGVRMTVMEAAAALRGDETRLDRHVGTPPEGPPNMLLGQLLSQALGRPLSDIRVVWLEKPVARTPDDRVMIFTSLRQGRGGPPRKLVLPAGQPRHGAVLTRWEDIPPLRLVTRALLKMSQPAFAASVRLADGRWLTVSPPDPIFGGWRLKVLAALGASLVVLAPLVWLFARRLTRPFRALATAIDNGRDPPQAQGPRELQEAAGAILQLRSRLARESAERLRMLTAIAHDLRTPLTSLKLRIEAVAEPQRSRMIADADRMQAMIADVLDFARTAETPARPVALRPLIAEIVADLPQVQLADGGELSVVTVEPGLRRAIENLVRNAVDYAGSGRIEITSDHGHAAIRVVDAGPGIRADDRARLLRPFERGEASRNRDTGGVGLGLSIVQGFAERHGGTLSLDDAPGGGTVATLTLPL